jgi:hypothetical protein
VVRSLTAHLDYDPRPYIASQTWTFARTVPQHPHEYLMMKRSSDPEEHRRFMDYLDATGEPGEFWGRTWRYVTVDEWTYWTSGPAFFINRRRAEPPKYRQLSLLTP